MGGPSTVEIPEMAADAVMWRGVRSYSGNRKPGSHCLREWKNPGTAAERQYPLRENG